jgi:uncharacterized OB-fold protein
MGTLSSASEVFVTPSGFGEAGPYIIGLISLLEGPSILAQLTDMIADEAKPGLRVQAVTRKIALNGHDGLIVYGYKFRPEIQAGEPEEG